MQKMIIAARGISKVHRQGRQEVVQALRGVNLEVPTGEFAAVVGASGSGKSTLLHILGFMDRASQGELLYNGRLVTNLPEAEMTRIRRTEIGFIFQTFNLIPSLCAWENVALPATGMGRRQRRERALELLDLVGLADRARHRPGELSGGQRQRVAIARALINQPGLLLADEPTGNLDSVTGAQIMALFARLNAAGHSVLLLTHNPEVAARCKRIYRMRDGQLRAITDEQVAAAYSS